MDVSRDLVNTFYNDTEKKRMHLDRNVLEKNNYYKIIYRLVASNTTRHVGVSVETSVTILVGNPPSNGSCMSDLT